jgi:hypothetical protein
MPARESLRGLAARPLCDGAGGEQIEIIKGAGSLPREEVIPRQLGPRHSADHLGAKFLATASAPRSLVSSAIFCASMTSPATR